MDIQEEREAFEALPQIKAILQGGNVYFSTLSMNYSSKNTDLGHCVYYINGAWYAWQAAKAQAVQSKQDLLDRVNARWQLAHEQCAENWNTYSSAQMDAFDWVEQDIKELLWEAQEPTND